MSEKRIWNEWLEKTNKKRVVKEISSLRKKAVWLEESLELLEARWELVQADSYYPEEYGVGYHEIYYVGKDGVKAAWAHAEMGLPSLAISCVSKAQWMFIRSDLREANLIR